jgi:hypothetical protein
MERPSVSLYDSQPTIVLTARSELVLRKPDGSFFPTYWLISVLCHEVGGNSFVCWVT